MKTAAMNKNPNGKSGAKDAPSNHVSTKGSRDKGVQYLLLSVAGYLCASVLFGFLLNNTKKRINYYSFVRVGVLHQ
jgi:hypothetical protein